jgi:antitoxin component HigA of HigAB toxin-antitoxin module
MSPSLTHVGKTGYLIGGSYQQLLKRYPLLPIKSKAEYERAADVLQDLFGCEGLDADERGYLETLTLLVQAYEDRHEHFDERAEQVTPLDALKSLLDSHGMKSKDLGQIIGSESAASLILNGKREISKAYAKLFARRFKVDAGLFI